jgi:hypothetical protein
MIHLTTFTFPRVDTDHLCQLAGTGRTAHIIGILWEVRNVDYNQECVVEMYDGFLVNVVDGPVCTAFRGFMQAQMWGTHSVCWQFDVGHCDKGGWEHC